METNEEKENLNMRIGLNVHLLNLIKKQCIKARNKGRYLGLG